MSDVPNNKYLELIKSECPIFVPKAIYDYQHQNQHSPEVVFQIVEYTDYNHKTRQIDDPLSQLRCDRDYIDIMELFRNFPRNFKQREKMLLFVRGAPGSGKSHAAKLIVREANQVQSCQVRHLEMNRFTDYAAFILEFSNLISFNSAINCIFVEIHGGSLKILKAISKTAKLHGTLGGYLLELKQPVLVCMLSLNNSRCKYDIMNVAEQIQRETPPLYLTLVRGQQLYARDKIFNIISKCYVNNILSRDYSTAAHKIEHIIDPISTSNVTKAILDSSPVFKPNQVIDHKHKKIEDSSGAIQCSKIIEHNHQSSLKLKEFLENLDVKSFMGSKRLPVGAVDAKNVDRQKIEEIQAKFGSCLTLKESGIGLEKQFIDSLPLIDATDKLVRISSNCPMLITKAYYEKLLQNGDVEGSFIFIELEMLNGNKGLELVQSALKLAMPPTIIVNCGDRQDWPEIIKKMQDKKIDRRTVFLTNENSSCHYLSIENITITLCWPDLTSEYQDQLLNAEVDIQGHKTKILSIFGNHTKAVIPIEWVTENKKIIIGKPLPMNEKCFNFPRKYLRLDGPEDICSSAELARTVLLADSPKSGKTYELIKIAHTLKIQFPSLLIFFMNLENDQVCSSLQFENSKSVSDFIMNKVLKIKEIEAKIFLHLFNSGNVVVFIDGFDETTTGLQNCILNFAIGMRAYTKNQLWISTRPKSKALLEEKLNVSSFEMNSFDEIERRENLARYFQSKECDIAQTLSNVEKVELLFKKLHKPNDFQFKLSPLLLSLIAERLISDDKNVFAMFEEIVQILIRTGIENDDISHEAIAKLYGKDISTFCQKLSIDTVFGNNIELATLRLSFPHTMTASDVEKAGIIYFLNSSDFKFTYHAMAYFFCAQYLYEEMVKNAETSHQTFCKVLIILLSDVGQYGMILTFLDSAVKNKMPEESSKKKILRMLKETHRNSQESDITEILDNNDWEGLKKLLS